MLPQGARSIARRSWRTVIIGSELLRVATINSAGNKAAAGDFGEQVIKYGLAGAPANPES